MRPQFMARTVLFTACAILAASTVLAAEDKPDLLGSFREWHVYQTGKGPNRLCYALSQPKEMTPKDAKRDSVFFLISTWPVRKVRNEPSVMAGYAYKDGGKAEIQVGADKFNFFTKNDGGAGGAWMEDAKDEKKLIDAMKKGSGMSVAGITARGVLTKDTYSLAGISAALDKLDSSCK